MEFTTQSLEVGNVQGSNGIINYIREYLLQMARKNGGRNGQNNGHVRSGGGKYKGGGGYIKKPGKPKKPNN